MSSFTKPIASSIGGVDFGFLSEDEIKAISVKRVYATPTFDSLNQPLPGGLYDPALGAWGDYSCTTCRQGSWSCTGHSGHIEIPVHVYNVTFFDQLLRLLKAQCVFCFRLRMSRVQVNAYICKLKLLQHGLIEEVATLDKMEIRKSASHNIDINGSDSGGDEDSEDFMKRRKAFVRRCIKRAASQRKSQETFELKDPIAAEQRRAIVREFLRDISSVAKCANCSGISPKFRRDKYSKVFRKPLPTKHKASMIQAGFQAPNPVILIEQEKQSSEKPKEAPAEGSMGDDGSSAASESHGAEEQVARDNAVSAIVEGKENGKKPQSSEPQQFVPSPEVHAYLSLLFEKEQEIFDLVYNSRPRSTEDAHVKADLFFIKHILVPPNKYRPAVAQGSSEIVEAQQNSSFTRILKICDRIHEIEKERRSIDIESAAKTQIHREFLYATVQLQDAVNSLIDRDRNPIQGAAGKQNEDGIKQRLEKKDGLFRKNMMGKRVNFAARSVISPDPNIETNEIGIPMVFAKNLTYPEPVTDHNYSELYEAVVNGPDKYPGAAAIENEQGQVVSLKMKNVEERVALASSLITPGLRVKGSRNKKVYRHLTTGDVVLMNRQPTLHKPSIMGHRARVLPGERTIRMHYANCNTYNADFDGDEMNLHFPQNEIARAEAMQLADTDHQYLVATSGKPLRGLIQDHISMGTWFTSRDSLFDQDDYHQLLYSCLRPENAHTSTGRIKLVDPAIIRPEPRWTGKQVISTILKNITPPTRVGLNLTGKLSTSADHWEDESESRVILQDGELLCGILDKSQLGPTAGGLIHSIHEVYGHVIAGKLIGILGRLLTKFLHMRAFTCGMDDLRLTKTGDLNRKKKLEKAKTVGHEVALKYVSLDQSSEEDQEEELRRRLEDVLRDDEKQAGLDGVSNAHTARLSSEITAACLPSGLEKKFPWNQMQAMTVSGAKGSIVNANLISCNLGQQVLEGRRVPVMISGKTLPSFQPFETNAMAGGYVSGRFLTGIKPQEYYFHAMAGREGLIDTAVKTSRSGYLQRCLIKGMEGLKVEYDTSVRESSDGSVVQFLYGEDGLDITKQKHLQDFSFLASNYLSIVSQVNAKNFHDLSDREAANWNKAAMKKVKKTGKLDAMDPALSKFHPGGYLGSTSELFAAALKKYEDQNPDKLLKDKKDKTGKISKKTFSMLMAMKYMRSVVDPGEAVGIVAGQSVGEPSTQMTLNTFHLAGHSTKNVTLGIPRLREIVMTASDKILTPTMTMQLNPEVPDEHAEKFAKGISKLTLAEVVDKLRVHERIGTGDAYATAKIYDIRMDFFPREEYKEEYDIKPYDILKALQKEFIPRLTKLTKAELKKRTEEESLSANSAAQPNVGVSSGTVEEASRDAEQGEEDNDAGDGDDDDEDNESGKRRGKDRSNPVSYDAPDEGETTIGRQETPEPESEDEEHPGTQQSGDVNMEDADDSEAEATKNPKSSEDTVKGKYHEVTRFRFDPKKGTSCTVQLQYDVSTPKLLLLPLVENAVRSAVLQSIPGLGDTTFVPENKGKPRHIDAEGVNLLAMRDYQDIIVPHSLYTNSIADMLSLYGVEAARATIIKEMDAVFGGHSIAVDNRHLNLIGDVMTQSGGFKAFNRMGVVKSSTSPFMKMSFETTVGFLRDAVLERDWDTLSGPSGRIVAGQVGKIGTGGFDVLAPVG